jgi:hypothetical protein
MGFQSHRSQILGISRLSKLGLSRISKLFKIGNFRTSKLGLLGILKLTTTWIKGSHHLSHYSIIYASSWDH